MTVIGEVEGQICIIVDDICDTAGTLCKAAEVLMETARPRCTPTSAMACCPAPRSSASPRRR
jgi:phosphoribosylpyrophosphate synthetase